MRIAINAVGEVGVRAGRILSTERDLVALGVYGDTKGLGQDRRIIPTSTLAGYDALVTDDVASAATLVQFAADDGLGSVIPTRLDARTARRIGAAGVAVLQDCSLAGLAATLASHEAARVDQAAHTSIAWTVPGKPRRSGVPVPFPDPVGARWAKRVGPRSSRPTMLAASVDGEWSGATATVAGTVADRPVTRIVGVADQTAHLEAIALAAGAVVVATTDHVGVMEPQDVAAAYLMVALRMGLGVATYSASD